MRPIDHARMSPRARMLAALNGHGLGAFGTITRNAHGAVVGVGNFGLPVVSAPVAVTPSAAPDPGASAAADAGPSAGSGSAANRATDFIASGGAIDRAAIQERASTGQWGAEAMVQNQSAPAARQANPNYATGTEWDGSEEYDGSSFDPNDPKYRPILEPGAHGSMSAPVGAVAKTVGAVSQALGLSQPGEPVPWVKVAAVVGGLGLAAYWLGTRK